MLRMRKRLLVVSVLISAIALGGCNSQKESSNSPNDYSDLSKYNSENFTFMYDEEYWGKGKDYSNSGRDGAILENSEDHNVVSLEYSSSNLNDTQIEESLKQYKKLLSNDDVKNEEKDTEKFDDIEVVSYSWNDLDDTEYEVAYVLSDMGTVVVNMSLSNEDSLSDRQDIVNSVEIKKRFKDKEEEDGYSKLKKAKITNGDEEYDAWIVDSKDGVYEGYSVSGSSDGVTTTTMLYEDYNESEDFATAKISEVMDTEKGMLEGLSSYSNLKIGKVESNGISYVGRISYNYALGETKSNGYIVYVMNKMSDDLYSLCKIEVNNLEKTDNTQEIVEELEYAYGTVLDE